MLDRKTLQRIFLVHGEYERQLALQKALGERNYANVQIPQRGEKFEF
jgi:hypothetical protein